jgi:putative ABC transport system permease protein
MNQHQHQRPPARRLAGMAAIVADTLRGLRSQRRRLLPTFAAVLLGVAFTAGTLILTDTLGSAFDAMHTDNHANIDVAVRRTASFGSGADAERGRISGAVASEVASVDGVAAAAGRTSGWAQLVGPAGALLGDVSSGVDPVGENWIVDPLLNPWRLVDGVPPVGATMAVIDRAAADELGASVGDTVDILALGGTHHMTLSGIATFGDADSRFGTVSVLFDEPTAQSLLGEPGRHDSVVARIEPGVSTDIVAERIEGTVTAVDGDVEVVTGAELAEEAHAAHMRDWAFFDVFMAGFAAIALVVGGFIIFNTFSITVAQRTREFALLRAIGAGRGQVLGSVLVESSGVAVLASALGLAAGIWVSRALHALFGVFGIDLPDTGLVVAPASLAISFALGVGITLVSALLPALRAARVRPLAALRDATIDRAATSRVRIVAGTAVLATGAAAIAAGLGSIGSLALVGVGGLAVFASATVLGPVFVGPFIRLLGWPIARLRGMPGQLARDNSTRCPKRTAATAGALTIGVGLVGLIAIVAASTKASIDDVVSSGVRADVVVESNSFGLGGLDRSLAARLRALPETSAVSGVAGASAEVDGEVIDVVGVDSANIGSLFDFGRIDGSLTGPDGSGLGTDRIAVNADVAADRGWAVGSPVVLTLADGVKRSVTVGAVIEDPYIGLPTLVDSALLDTSGTTTFDLQVFVALADGINHDAGITAIAAAAEGFPQAIVLDRAGFGDHRSALVDPLLGVIYALLAFAVLIAALGIMNTLALSIMERTRELGVLRAIGATRTQVRTIVRWESVMIAWFGTMVGLVIGTGFGWAVVRALESEGITNLVVPTTTLATVAVLAAAAGVAAAVVPARRAARLDVLDALRS